MSKTDSLHHKLCNIGAEWLRKQQFSSYKIVAVELVCAGIEQPDVWGTTGWESTLIEVKTSHSDFLNDKKKKKNDGSEISNRFLIGNRRYYLAPKGIISIDELPEHWGLLEWNGESIEVRKQSDFITCQNCGELAILCSIMRREGVKNGIFNYRK